MSPPTELTSAALRTPRVAGLAGIAFAALFGLALVLLRVAAPSNSADAGAWLTDASRRSAVRTALNLVPFAGIAFLWFMGSVRSRIGAAEDRFFATLYVGSGLLFVAMLFADAAIAGGLISAAAVHQGTPNGDVWQFGRQVTFSLLTVYAMRMAAVFVITTSLVGMKLGLLPRWLARVGFGAAFLLLVTSGAVRWMELVFPVWVLVVAIHLLGSSAAPLSTPTAAGGTADAPSAG
ncbi:MAG: hypothetical protein ACXV3C_08950 [Actinomycetes bacterium]